MTNPTAGLVSAAAFSLCNDGIRCNNAIRPTDSTWPKRHGPRDTASSLLSPLLLFPLFRNKALSVLAWGTPGPLASTSWVLELQVYPHNASAAHIPHLDQASLGFTGICLSLLPECWD